MRAAKQQATDLDHIEKVFDGVVVPGSKSSQGKDEVPADDEQASKQTNVKLRPIRTDNIARFADPPAPPPQQPLPENPDSAKSTSLNSLSLSSLLKRTDTAKPGSNGSSPTNGSQNSMLQLVEALSQARKELESHSIRVKELEDMLSEEKSARVVAEERARKLEQTAAARPVTKIEEITEPDANVGSSSSETEPSDITEKSRVENENDLQKRLDLMVAEMQKMKVDMDRFKNRAETAEEDATKARESLADMIKRLRQENEDEDNVPRKNEKTTRSSPASGSTAVTDDEVGTIKPTSNGHVRKPRLPAHLEHAVTTALRQGGTSGDDGLAQSAPYVSMLGVVLIGVGLMAYLNSWQKTDK